MPSWKKVITSGSDATLNSLNVINGITGSLLGTASYATTALSASYALTASYALNGGGGGGSTFPYTGSAEISGSLTVTGSSSLRGNNGGGIVLNGSYAGSIFDAPTVVWGNTIVNTFLVKNAYDNIILKVKEDGTLNLGIFEWFAVDPGQRYMYRSANVTGILSIASCPNIGSYLNLYASEHPLYPSQASIIASTFSIGSQPAIAKLHVKGNGSTSSTTALLVENSGATGSLAVLDDGNVGINTTTPSAKLHIDGTVRIDNQNSSTPTGPNASAGTVSNYWGTADGTFLSTPSTWLKVNLGGTDYYLPAYV